jgi:MinD superfamily P-loop ATPase
MAGPNIAVASGKGGTGKTTVSTALAVTLSRSLAESQFLDCDVEEPDAAHFLKPEIENSTAIMMEAPEVDRAKCTGCGECESACQFKAIRVVGGKTELHENLCQGCGSCKLVCSPGAIAEKRKRIGVVERGRRESIVFYRGILDVGRYLTARVIRALKSMARGDIPTILDCGPGTASPVLATIRGCDYCILVTEPTPFGLYDLKMMAEVVAAIGVRAGIVINKDDSWDPGIEEYASRAEMPILMRIPLSMEIASLCSRGIALTEADASWDSAFWALYEKVGRIVWKSP